MTEQSFTTAVTLTATPAEVYTAITDVRGWWSESVDGDTATVGGEFTYSYEDLHSCRMRVTELVPGRRVAWLVLENAFGFPADATEWIGTTVEFDITGVDGGTELRFTHRGLVPAFECYDACSTGWTFYITDSLRELATTGAGRPNATGRPQVATEEAGALITSGG